MLTLLLVMAAASGANGLTQHYLLTDLFAEPLPGISATVSCSSGLKTPIVSDSRGRFAVALSSCRGGLLHVTTRDLEGPDQSLPYEPGHLVWLTLAARPSDPVILCGGDPLVEDTPSQARTLRVLGPGDQPLSGVAVTLSGFTSGTTATDADGLVCFRETANIGTTVGLQHPHYRPGLRAAHCAISVVRLEPR